MQHDRASPAAEPAAKPRWQRRSAARPFEITRAALEVFAQKGFAATRMEDIARRAGVSAGTIYLYFNSKEEVLKAAVRESLVNMLGRTEDAVANSEHGSGDDQLRETLCSWFRSLEGQPAAVLPKLMVAEVGNFPELARFYLDEVVNRARNDLGAILDRGAAAGDLRRIDPRYGIPVIVAPLVWFFLWQSSMGAFDAQPIEPEAYLQAFVDLLLDGLRPRSEPPD